MSKLYLALDEQGYVVGMGDNPDVYPRCIEAPEWFDPGQHFKTGRGINGELVVDLDAIKASRKAHIKAQASAAIAALQWRIERAEERDRLGLPGETVEEVLLERETGDIGNRKFPACSRAADRQPRQLEQRHDHQPIHPHRRQRLDGHQWAIDKQPYQQNHAAARLRQRAATGE
jgi:hypothetical protein